MTGTWRPARRTIYLWAAIALFVLGAGWLLLDNKLSNDAADREALDIRHHGVPATAHVVGIIMHPNDSDYERVEYTVGGENQPGAVGCPNVDCDPVGTPIAITVDPRHPDRFITDDGRLHIRNAPNYRFLRVLLGVWMLGAGALFVRVRRASAPPKPERDVPPEDGPPAWAGYRIMGG
jgi:hypothetical protein